MKRLNLRDALYRTAWWLGWGQAAARGPAALVRRTGRVALGRWFSRHVLRKL